MTNTPKPKHVPLTPQEIGVRLKAHRERLAISVVAAAEAVEITSERLIVLETGEASITSLEIHRLSKLYKTTLNTLLL